MKQATSPKSQRLVLSQRLREGLFLLNIAVALYLLISLITYSHSDPGWSSSGTGATVTNAGGLIGAWFADCFLYIFGYLAYLFPILVAYGAWLFFQQSLVSEEKDYSLISLRCLGFVLLLLSACALASLYLSNYADYLPFTAGGILGDLIGFSLVNNLNLIGSSLLLFALLLGGLTWFTGISWFGVTNYLLFALRVTASASYTLTQKIVSRIKNRPRISLIKWRKPLLRFPSKEQQVISAEAIHFEVPVDNSVIVDAIEMPAEPVVIMQSAKVKKQASKSKIAPVIFRQNTDTSLPNLSNLEQHVSINENTLSRAELQARSQDVEQRLQDFSIDAKVVAVHPGPVITRYELALAPGIKVSKITALAKDLARSLSMISVRIVEVIPGKSVIGIELPNKSREIVRLREIFESQQYAQARSPVSLALGKDIAGHPVIVDLAKMPHLLVAGTTGSGKSVGVNAMLLSILYKSTPAEVRLILVDPKMLELSIYDGIPHLLTPVVTDMKEAANALRWCVAEMERRYRLMASLGVRNLAGYNLKVQKAIDAGEPLPDPFASPTAEDEQKTLEQLPVIVVMVDEFADMMMVVGKKVEQLIARIAQKARAAGIHLILATQRPSVDVITGLIKANVPTRISFQVSSKIDSRTILDQTGAEQLLGQGDMLYLPPGSGVPVRVHGAFVADEEVHNVVNELKQHGEPDYLLDIVEGVDDGSSDMLDGMGGDDDEQDEFYDLAVHFVTQTRRVSISSIQRRFKIGFNRAARIVETMERGGVISGAESGGSREVLAPPPAE